MSLKTEILAHRRIALARPCVEAMDCADARYAFLAHPQQGIRCSVLLTVNVGLE